MNKQLPTHLNSKEQTRYAVKPKVLVNGKKAEV